MLDNIFRAGIKDNRMRIEVNKKAQVTIFIIVAIVLIGAIVVFLAVRGNISFDDVPVEFRPVYNQYVSCIEAETENAVELLGIQGGRIDVGTYVPGSEYAPFASHLNFLGVPVPYWYYVAGNNVVAQNVPSRSDMEREISVFVAERLGSCDFDLLYQQGFYVELPESEEIEVDTVIEDERISVSVKSDVVSLREDRSARKTNYDIKINSKIGKLHSIARDVYNMQQEILFLEEYSVDVLRLYAPVDGVEISCGPEIWQTREVVDELKNGLEANIGAIKLEGSYYDLAEREDEYFVVSSLEVDEPVRFIYSEDWPSKIEIAGQGVDQDVMIAEPVGNQEGLGIIGFCYAPYHFVYDVSFPVMVQVGDSFEIFQFPMAVIIDNNLPREVELLTLAQEDEGVDVCEFAEGDVRVNTYDNTLSPVEAEIRYNCFDSLCHLGKTEIRGNDASLNTEIPICVNGYLIARAEGFAEKKQLFSSNFESVADIILERVYEIDVEVDLIGSVFDETKHTAVIQFTEVGGNQRATAILPENKVVKLKEGLFDVSVNVYGESGISIPASTRTECFEINKGGLLGLFGGVEEKCVNVEIPAQNIDFALVGGGKVNTYILESELQNGRVKIEASTLPIPNSLEQLQYNYEVFDSFGVDFDFK